MDSFFENIFKKENEISWGAYSDLDVVSAIKTIAFLGDDWGINVFPPHDSFIQSTSFNIKFRKTDYGCNLDVYIFGNNEDSSLFIRLWAVIQNYKKVRGGQYAKEFADLFSKLSFKKQSEADPKSEIPQIDGGQDELNIDPLIISWEHMDGANRQEINLVRIWCIDTEQGPDLARKTNYDAPSVVLHRLRDTYKEAKIPIGKIGRKIFRKRYLEMQMNSKIVKSIR